MQRKNSKNKVYVRPITKHATIVKTCQNNKKSTKLQTFRKKEFPFCEKNLKFTILTISWVADLGRKTYPRGICMHKKSHVLNTFVIARYKTNEESLTAELVSWLQKEVQSSYVRWL